MLEWGGGCMHPHTHTHSLPAMSLFLYKDTLYAGVSSFSLIPERVLPSQMNWMKVGFGVLGPEDSSNFPRNVTGTGRRGQKDNKIAFTQTTTTITWNAMSKAQTNKLTVYTTTIIQLKQIGKKSKAKWARKKSLNSQYKANCRFVSVLWPAPPPA